MSGGSESNTGNRGEIHQSADEGFREYTRLGRALPGINGEIPEETREYPENVIEPEIRIRATVS